MSPEQTQLIQTNITTPNEEKIEQSIFPLADEYDKLLFEKNMAQDFLIGFTKRKRGTSTEESQNLEEQIAKYQRILLTLNGQISNFKMKNKDVLTELNTELETRKVKIETSKRLKNDPFLKEECFLKLSEEEQQKYIALTEEGRERYKFVTDNGRRILFLESPEFISSQNTKSKLRFINLLQPKPLSTEDALITDAHLQTVEKAIREEYAHLSDTAKKVADFRAGLRTKSVLRPAKNLDRLS